LKHDENCLDSYRIVVEGSAGQPWTDWFEGLHIDFRRDAAGKVIATEFIYQAADPSALHGVLAQIGSLGLRLVTVERLVDAKSNRQDKE